MPSGRGLRHLNRMQDSQATRILQTNEQKVRLIKTEPDICPRTSEEIDQTIVGAQAQGLFAKQTLLQPSDFKGQKQWMKSTRNHNMRGKSPSTAKAKGSSAEEESATIGLGTCCLTIKVGNFPCKAAAAAPSEKRT